MNRSIYPLFFISGVSGLIYQVIWVRMFGNIFGNSVYSAALVTSVFMFGLGVGSFLAGRIVDAHDRNGRGLPVRLYAYSEILIGALGTLLAVALPHLAALSASLSSYVTGEDGWRELSYRSYALRYAIAVLLLAPITLVMGGTLTLLIRFVVRPDLQKAGQRTGWLYGINTLGAAVGSLAVDFVLVPSFGLFSTQLCAVFLNLLAGAGALRLSTSIRAANFEAPPPGQKGPATAIRGGPGLPVVWIALFLSGFAAMGMEIIWFRFLSSALGQFRGVFSLLLAVILLGLWLGACTGGALSSLGRNPARVFVFAQLAFAASTLAAFWAFEAPNLLSTASFRRFVAMDHFTGSLFELWLLMKPTALLVGAPAFFMGFSFPVANALVQDSAPEIGRRAGLLYLGNTFGAVAGSLAAGFVFIPLLGSQQSVLIFTLAAGATCIIIPFHRGARSLLTLEQRPLAVGYVLLLVALVLGLASWRSLPRDFLILRTFSSKDVVQYLRPPFMLSASEGVSESIIVLAPPEPGSGRLLYTNGHIMSGTAEGAQRYMRAFAHLPLLMHRDPKSVLVICFGVGNTLHAASLHPGIERLEIVDLSKHVLRHAGFFAASNGNVLEDPRVSVFVNDGRQHLRMQEGEKYDLVTLEPPPISFAGVSSLYSVEFYELVKRHLNPDGFLTQWLPIRQLTGDAALSLVRAFLEVFPEAVLLNGEYGDLILMGNKAGKVSLDLAGIQQKILASPEVKADLERIHLATSIEIAGLFAADARTLRAASDRSPPVTDDHPILEYAQTVFLASRVPAELFDWTHVWDWCPECRSSSERDDLETYLKILQTLNRDESFALVTPWNPPFAHIRGLPLSKQQFRETRARSPYLRRLLTRFTFDSGSFDSSAPISGQAR